MAPHGEDGRAKVGVDARLEALLEDLAGDAEGGGDHVGQPRADGDGGCSPANAQQEDHAPFEELVGAEVDLRRSQHQG